MDDMLEKLARAWERRNQGNAAHIFTVPGDVKHLDTGQLTTLERALRDWADATPRSDVRASRRRILLLFLVLRHTGARLGEACALDLAKDFRPAERMVALGEDAARRSVPLPASLADELRRAREETPSPLAADGTLAVEPGHLRRKLYERAEECGLARDLANPTVIRRSRGIELLRQNVPLPVVQRTLGQSTPSLAGDYLDFSDKDMDRTLRGVVDRESRRTSARNSFYGRITRINPGDIQSEVRLTSVGGHEITAIITNESVSRLDFREGRFATAEIKAPWIIVSATDTDRNSAVNRLCGTVSRLIRGRLTTEVIVRLDDGLEVCAVITEGSRETLDLAEGDKAWVMFNAFAVILGAD
ncbi:TOBE domain-containing protein [Desulfocurvus sp. DL9XJH121]